MKKNSAPVIALTAGEPAGIGPDLCIQLAQQPRREQLVVVANARMLEERAQQLKLPWRSLPAGALSLAAGEMAVLDEDRRDLDAIAIEHHAFLELARLHLGSLDGHRTGLAVGEEAVERLFDVADEAPLREHAGQVRAAQVRVSGDGAHLLHRIHRAQLGGLRQAHHLGLGVVDVAPAADHLLDGVRAELAQRAGRGQHLGAVGEELGGPALVGLDVGHLAADDGVVALAHGGERQRVGRRAVEDEEDLAVGLEGLPEEPAGPLGPGIVAVGGGVAAVGLGHGLPGFGTDPGIVVAGKLVSYRVRHLCLLFRGRPR